MTSLNMATWILLWTKSRANYPVGLRVSPILANGSRSFQRSHFLPSARNKLFVINMFCLCSLHPIGRLSLGSGSDPSSSLDPTLLESYQSSHSGTRILHLVFSSKSQTSSHVLFCIIPDSGLTLEVNLSLTIQVTLFSYHLPSNHRVTNRLVLIPKSLRFFVTLLFRSASLHCTLRPPS